MRASRIPLLPMDDSGRLFVTEIFSAIQGEGRYVGARQIFLRLAGCNLRCVYCDEPGSLEKKPGVARIEATPGLRDFYEADSPMPVAAVHRVIDAVESQLAHGFLSVTGGEPLVQPAALAEFLPACRASGIRIAVETNGTRPDALKAVVVAGDIVSMDIKLDSVDGEGVSSALQREFFEAAQDIGAEVYCKAVIGESVDRSEIVDAASWIADVDPGAILYLQPVSPGGGQAAPSPRLTLELQALAMAELRDTRVLPQVHRLTGQK